MKIDRGYNPISVRFDQLTETIFQECTVYKIYVSPEIINYYLPNQLLGFRAHTRRNPIRRFLFFSEQAAITTRTQLDDYIDQLPYSISFDSFLKHLSKETDPSVRYNFVIMNDYFIFIRVPYLRNKAYRALCKHITISSRAQYARFAGEIWSNGYKHFLVNNHSGTYRPPDQMIEPVIQLFKYLSSNVYFQGISFRFSRRPNN